MQTAEAFPRDMTGDRFEALSAAVRQQSLTLDGVSFMDEMGLDIFDETPKKVDLFVRECVAFLVTLCDREKECTCPIFPGATWRHKWPLDNTASAPDRQRSAITCRVRDKIRGYVTQFVQEHA